ncbi:hypothetical protein BBJ28_00002506, partial [Nothophytophthora sp. Chile5]
MHRTGSGMLRLERIRQRANSSTARFRRLRGDTDGGADDREVNADADEGKQSAGGKDLEVDGNAKGGDLEGNDDPDGIGDEVGGESEEDEDAPAGNDSTTADAYEASECKGSESDGAESEGKVSHSGRVRRVEKTSDVRVEPPAAWHSSWEAWFSYLVEYTRRTMQVLPISEVLSRDARNKRLANQKKGREGRVDFVPGGCGPFQRIYICTHGWIKRKTRCTGSRKRQHIRLTDCPFRFTVQWVQKDGSWKLHVKNGLFVHNHAVTADTFGTYPASRGVDDARIEARVDG